ncbi:hypothetical protein [Deinococcus peraridilitoris]|uniref:Uncharacterized protein n=1 Tax=Deinococcus peraridilitoris (strain DSM 19664 / LMG 22246 / CIP 109416 / KR-200) TaxID=937777 RepID=L0A4M5_DEIPD|nr:hypothetical protein [Deinococcus peraridilitoris]AFZ68806.1 hypothetical protein Deipe_3366 [Deinococcus peraridilitoris DSM 19664]
MEYKPAGYLLLESYSSLRRFWSYLDGAERTGRQLAQVRGDHEHTCRRRIEGYTLPGAGGLVDLDKARAEIEDDFIPGVELLALAAGDPRPLQEMLSERYDLQIGLTLAFTRTRDLILKPELLYRAKEADALGIRFTPRRFGRDELRVMLDRACGLT